MDGKIHIEIPFHWKDAHVRLCIDRRELFISAGMGNGQPLHVKIPLVQMLHFRFPAHQAETDVHPLLLEGLYRLEQRNAPVFFRNAAYIDNPVEKLAVRRTMNLSSRRQRRPAMEVKKIRHAGAREIDNITGLFKYLQIPFVHVGQQPFFRALDPPPLGKLPVGVPVEQGNGHSHPMDLFEKLEIDSVEKGAGWGLYITDIRSMGIQPGEDFRSLLLALCPAVLLALQELDLMAQLPEGVIHLLGPDTGARFKLPKVDEGYI